jgi:hypothetical protein
MDEVERCVEIDAAAHVAVADRTQERSVAVLAVLQPEMGVERLTESLVLAGGSSSRSSVHSAVRLGDVRGLPVSRTPKSRLQ